MNRSHISTSILALAAGFFIASGPASASDLFGSAPDDPGYAQQPARSWSGIWIGALGGYQIGNSELNFDAKEIQGEDKGQDARVPLGGLEESFDLDIDGLGQQGLFGELQLGYDQQVTQRIVVGVFGGFNLNNAEFSIDASSFNAWDDPQSESANILSFNQEWGGVLGARVGVLKSPDTMFYVAGGWAFGELSQVTSEGAKVFENQETDMNGWFGELGMETRVYNNIYLTVAGRYTDYSAITLDSESGSCGADTCSYALELDKDDLSAMVGLKAKLGGY